MGVGSEKLCPLTSFLAKPQGHGVDILEISLFPRPLPESPGGCPLGPGSSRCTRRRWVHGTAERPACALGCLPRGRELGHAGPEAEEQGCAGLCWATVDTQWGKVGLDGVTVVDEVLVGGAVPGAHAHPPPRSGFPRWAPWGPVPGTLFGDLTANTRVRGHVGEPPLVRPRPRRSIGAARVSWDRTLPSPCGSFLPPCLSLRVSVSFVALRGSCLRFEGPRGLCLWSERNPSGGWQPVEDGDAGFPAGPEGQLTVREPAWMSRQPKVPGMTLLALRPAKGSCAGARRECAGTGRLGRGGGRSWPSRTARRRRRRRCRCRSLRVGPCPCPRAWTVRSHHGLASGSAGLSWGRRVPLRERLAPRPKNRAPLVRVLSPLPPAPGPRPQAPGPSPQPPALAGMSLPSEQGLCATGCRSARVGRTDAREGTGRTLGTWRRIWRGGGSGEEAGCFPQVGWNLTSAGWPRKNEVLGHRLGRTGGSRLQGRKRKRSPRVEDGQVSRQRRASDLGPCGCQESLYALEHTDRGRNRHPPYTFMSSCCGVCGPPPEGEKHDVQVCRTPLLLWDAVGVSVCIGVCVCVCARACV